MNIGKRMKSIRKSKGITITFVAKSLGVSVSTICKYESGKRQPTAQRLNKIAKILGCSIENFFEEELDETSIKTSA